MGLADEKDWEFLYLEKFTIPNYDKRKQSVNGYQFFEYVVAKPVLRIGVNVENQRLTWNLGCYAYQLVSKGLLLSNYKFGNQSQLSRQFCRAGMGTICQFLDLGKPYTLMIQLPLWLLSVQVEIHQYLGAVADLHAVSLSPQAQQNLASVVSDSVSSSLSPAIGQVAAQQQQIERLLEQQATQNQGSTGSSGLIIPGIL